MHIELRKLKVVDALSEETTCYSAEIWIDGQRAFLASNRGHGAADDYHAVGSVTEQAVDVLAGPGAPLRERRLPVRRTRPRSVRHLDAEREHQGVDLGHERKKRGTRASLGTKRLSSSAFAGNRP